MVYRAYKPDKGWWIMELVKIFFICIVITYMFYNSLIFIPVTIPVAVALFAVDKKNYAASQRSRLRMEFKDVISMLSGNLNVGYSLENAFIRARADMQKLYGAGYLLEEELGLIVNGLACNLRLEDMLLSLGKRCDIEEISECAQLLVTAKEYGGSMIKIIHRIAGNLSERMAVELEIDRAVAAKRMEGIIMLVMPCGIIAYMRIMNQSYISILYHSLAGRFVMTIALVITVAAGVWINRIVRIEV